MRKPLAIDLFCGLGGWTDGLLAEGYDVIGFDIERHEYGEQRYPGQLVIQDVLTLHGSQFKDAALIVASPPCQEYSYMAMPWKLAKAKAAAIRADASGQKLADLNRLFDACFRIQNEACIAAGRHVPLIVENVRGAIPWVGRSRWNFGSFHLWGDVPALMPVAARATKNAGGSWFNVAHNTTSGKGQNPVNGLSVEHTDIKAPGMDWSNPAKRGQDFTRIAGKHAAGVKNEGHLNRRDGYDHTPHLTNPAEHDDSIKLGGSWFHGYRKGQGPRNHSSGSKARKAASAMIAKIPLPLSRHIAATFRPISQKQPQNPQDGQNALGGHNHSGQSASARPAQTSPAETSD